MSSPTPAFRQARFGAPLLLLAAVATACGGAEANVASDPSTETYASSLGVMIANMTLLRTGLYTQDLIVGAGLEAISGRTLRVRYTGWLTTGQQFDSNQTTGLQFVLNRGSVIPGWDLGLVGIRPGGKRRLVIGSDLAYGSSGKDIIGPNQTLVFDITCLTVV
ncbi:MAG: FKBP-type peptidyl-prolyl cis-trans isomerase [Gemmatimonadaceae bacterium]